MAGFPTIEEQTATSRDVVRAVRDGKILLVDCRVGSVQGYLTGTGGIRVCLILYRLADMIPKKTKK